jgi:thiol-disulfide isomerase/thioredoxin
MRRFRHLILAASLAALAIPAFAAEKKPDPELLAKLKSELAGISPDQPGFAAEALKRLDAFVEKNKGPEAARLGATLQLRILSNEDVPDSAARLEKLAKHSDREIAEAAAELLEREKFMAQLEKEPLDLKIPVTGGPDIEFSKLRGKVVLLDFWASWCGPCMQAAPDLVRLKNEFGPKGLEIIGISLDEDRAEMKKAIESAKLDWPHHFDGKGWQNKIAQKFGVESIPSVWLFDKSGKLHAEGLHGEQLEAAIKKLLEQS